ncbi:cold shock domain-containing protein [Kitasatospora sp. NPDC002227]|uniref:cold-shock protein n=1 Tax=Kitasatospora sp. NPDC002227 TaxID=3154773 RepID=UPI0033297F6C
MVAGRVVRFDGARGYGFIAPNHGGEDVFLHVNDLLIPESSLRTGLAVVFEVEEGDRGPKASAVQLAPASAGAAGRSGRTLDDVSLCDVLGADEYLGETTDALLEAAPTLTGNQIVQVRVAMLSLAKSHGWIG